MDKDFLENLETTEEARMEEIKLLDSKERINPFTAFKSDIVRKTIESGRQTLVSGFDNPILPNTIPFSDRTFIEICPRCSCVQSPKLLQPYLERDLIVPILNSSYHFYNPDFMEMIYSYPHMSSQEFYGIRNIALRNFSGTVSQKEIDSLKDSCITLAKKNSFIDSAAIATVIDHFEPYYTSDLPFLLEFYKSIQKRKKELYPHQRRISNLVSAFRCSQAFSFIPQVNLDQLKTLESIPYENRGVTFDLSDVRDNIMNSLKISYDSSIPIGTYLDIVSERKKKIRGIVKQVMDSSSLQNVTYLSDIEKELEKINSEVRSLKRSGKGKAVDLFTNFAVQNKGSIIAGLVTAASIGLMGFGVLGCGAGIASTVATKAVSSKASISIPQEAGVIGERISTFFEPSYEKLLATTLSADIRAVQVWRIQKHLSK